MKTLRLYTDGAARGNPGPAGLGVVIEDDGGQRLAGRYRYAGITTNNQAEYLALIDGLTAMREWRPSRLEVYMDSELVVRQLQGRYKVKNAELLPLHQRARRLLEEFGEYSLAHVERARNKGADALANRAIDEWQAAGKGKI